MGAEAVEELISRLGLGEEEEFLRETIATGKGQKKAKAIKRLKVVSAFNRRNDDDRLVNSPTGMVLRAVPSSRPTCAPWCSSTVAASPPPTSTTCTAG